MAIPTLTWTALPAGWEERDGRGVVRLSVFISPRLDGGERRELRAFEAFADWPRTLREAGPQGIELALELRSDDRPIAVTPVAPLAAMADADRPDSDAWRAIFPADTIVKPFEDRKAARTGAGLQSFPAGQLVEDIRALYRKALVACVQDAPAPNLADFTRDAVRLRGSAPINMTALEAFARFHAPSSRSIARAALRTEAGERPDFHEIAGSLGAYPRLLRKIGLVLDFALPVETLGLRSGMQDLRLRVTPKAAAMPEAVHHHGPWSAVAFAAGDDGRPPAFVMALPSSKNSLATLRLDDRKTTVIQEKLEHTAFALLHASRKASSFAPQLTSGEAPTTAELPALVQGGMRMTHHDVRGMTAQAMEAQNDLLNTLSEQRRKLAAAAPGGNDGTDDDDEDALLLDADHVLRGFRVDVRDVAEGVWRSLCQRRTRYAAGTWAWPANGGPLDDEGILEPLVYEDEGAKDGTQRILEDLFEWDGWSLVVPRDSAQHRRILAEQGQKAQASGTPLAVSSEVAPGSLTPQRFGRHYQFRLRKVDIAGNGPGPDAAHDAGPGTGAGTDPLPAAVTVSSAIPCLRVESVKAPVVVRATQRGPNEAGDVIVLRDADAPEYRTGEFRLHVLPPEVSLSIAEKHGVFDGMSNEASWTLLANHRGSLPGRSSEDAPDAIPAATYYAPYLPDPLARQAVMCLPDGAGSVDLPRFDDIPKDERGRRLARSCLLVIRPGGDSVKASVAGREVTLRIPRGRVQKVRLAAKLSEEDLALMAHASPDGYNGAQLRNGNFAAELNARAQRGDLPLLAPAETVTFVFATQRPLAAPAFGRPLILPRTRASTAALFADDDLRFDRPSTGRIDIYARWDDPVDDPAEDGWSEAGNRIHAGGVAIDEDGGKPLDPAELADAARSPLAHDFGDTRHREVTYRAVATSRFASFYPPSLTSDPDNITLASQSVTLSIPATAPPDQPDIAYVVPTIGRRKGAALDKAGEHKVVTHGDGLRIYLNRGWFSSGRGEQLALVLTHGAGDGEHRVAVSEWGENPLRVGAPLPGALELEHLWGGAQRIDHFDVDGEACALLVLDVHFSEEHRLPFADVTFLSQRAYLPMVRLALARYQRNAIDGCQLSNIVQADFVPLTPGRALTVKQTAGDRWYLAVRGYSYSTGATAREPATTIMTATIEVLPRDAGKDSIAWRPVTGPVRLDTASDEPWRYLWSTSIRVEEPDYLANTWRRRLVVEEVEPFPGGATNADARLVTLHTLEL
jgi:hypothetical protein